MLGVAQIFQGAALAPKIGPQVYGANVAAFSKKATAGASRLAVPKRMVAPASKAGVASARASAEAARPQIAVPCGLSQIGTRRACAASAMTGQEQQQPQGCDRCDQQRNCGCLLFVRSTHCCARPAPRCGGARGEANYVPPRPQGSRTQATAASQGTHPTPDHQAAPVRRYFPGPGTLSRGTVRNRGTDRRERQYQ